MKTSGIIWILIGMLLVNINSSIGQSIIYVDQDAIGLNNGSNWTDAYTDLQTALSSTSSNSELWVAAGVYVPGDTTTSTFELKNQIALYGGFAGNETNKNQRDWSLNETVLSGDIGQDDVYGFVVWYSGWGVNTYNSHHVVSSFGVGSSAVLDGFTITGGDIARGIVSPLNNEDYGGGLYNVNGSPTIENCIFTRNFCSSYATGAGFYSNGGDPYISNCVFTQNYAFQSRGAGIAYTGTGSPIIEHCQFIANTGFTGASLAAYGAGIYVAGPSPMTIRDCAFEDNVMGDYGVGLNASRGSGIYSGADGQVIQRCIFRDNVANLGSGICLNGNNNIVVNCLFNHNTAHGLPSPSGTGDRGDIAAGIYAAPGSLGDQETRIINCTFTNNIAGEAAAMDGGNFILENSIVWNNSSTGFGVEPLKGQVGGVADYFYSTVQFLFDTIPGEDPPNLADFPGCLDVDPIFAGPVDYQLAPGSTCIDAADADRLPAGVVTDLIGLSRATDDPATANTGIGAGPPVDMGCYEFNPPCDASTIPSGLASTIINPSKVSLSWAEIADVDGYQVTGGIIAGPTGSFVATSTTKTVSGLIPGSTYVWQLRSRCTLTGSITNYSVADTFTMPILREVQILELEIIPVPASDYVYIVGNTLTNLEVAVYGVNGQLVFKGLLQENKLDISNWNSGIYKVVVLGKGIQGTIVKN